MISPRPGRDTAQALPLARAYSGEECDEEDPRGAGERGPGHRTFRVSRPPRPRRTADFMADSMAVSTATVVVGMAAGDGDGVFPPASPWALRFGTPGITATIIRRTTTPILTPIIMAIRRLPPPAALRLRPRRSLKAARPADPGPGMRPSRNTTGFPARLRSPNEGHSGCPRARVVFGSIRSTGDRPGLTGGSRRRTCVAGSA